MTDCNYIGCYGETLFFAECIKRGYNVSKPILDSSVYDCIVDTHSGLYKVQIKSTGKEPSDGESNIKINIQNSQKDYSIELIDYFAVYSTYYNGFFIFRNEGNMQAIRFNLSGKWRDAFNNYNFNKDGK
jgi:hypothetical protein